MVMTVGVNGTELVLKKRGRAVVKRTVAPAGAETITIPALKVETFQLKLVGDSPLIINKFSNKAQQEILDKQMHRAKGARAAKDPEMAYQDSMHKDSDGDLAFPSIGFKAAAVTACSQNLDITKVVARGAFHLPGEYVKIEGKPRMRQDMVRIHMGTADVRFRAEVPEWSCIITVRHNPNVLSASQIINLFNVAGFSVGVGDWRPEKDGQFGMFHVEPA